MIPAAGSNLRMYLGLEGGNNFQDHLCLASEISISWLSSVSTGALLAS